LHALDTVDIATDAGNTSGHDIHIDFAIHTALLHFRQYAERSLLLFSWLPQLLDDY
jgi:hypothetical protein